MDRSRLVMMVVAIAGCSSKTPAPDLRVDAPRRDAAVDARHDTRARERGIDARRDGSAADHARDQQRDLSSLTDLAVTTDSPPPGDKLQDLCAWTIDASGDWRTYCGRSTGAGGFSTALKTVQSAISFTSYSVVVGDVNGDGKQDLCAWGIDNGTWRTHCALAVGNGTFQPAVQTAQSATSFTGYSVVVADVNGDGKQDLCVWKIDSGDWRTYCALAVGNGTFQTAVLTTQSATSFAGYSVVVGDVNGDGKQDLCAWKIDSGDWQTYCALATGSGAFQTAVKTVQGGTQFDGYSVVVGDVNGDGKKDLCAWKIDGGDWQTYCAVATSGGAFQVAVHTTQSASFGGYSMIDLVGDVNGDGKQDLCVWKIDSGDWRTSCALATGTGGFQAAVHTLQSATSFVGYSVVPADVNGDGKQDLCAWTIDNGDWRSYCALSVGGTFQPAVKTTQATTSFTGYVVIVVDAG
jgi:hypothetical protein